MVLTNEEQKAQNEELGGWYNKGDAFFKQGEFLESIRCCDEIIKVVPNNAKIWNNKGAAFIKLERYYHAFACFDKARNLDPTNSDFWHNTGIALKGLGGNDENAQECFDEAIKLDNIVAWNNKSAALYEQGEFWESISCCDEVIKLDPENSVGWKNKGIAYAALCYDYEARQCFLKSEKFYP